MRAGPQGDGAEGTAALRPAGPSAGARLGPWLLLVLAAAALLLLLPRGHYGDDVWLVHCIVRDFPFPPHFLYMPLARGASWLGAHAGLDPFRVLRLLSVAGAASGAALLLAAALRRGLPAGRALALALLVLGAPSTLFFATAAEIHAVHLGAVGLLAWVLAGLGPRSPARRVLAAGLAFGLVAGTHKSGGLLLPGCFALYLLATPGRAAAARRRDLGALAAAGALSFGVMVACNLLESGRPFTSEDGLAWYVAGLRGRLAQGYGWRDFAGYLARDGVLSAPALAIAGCAGLGALLRRRPRAGAAALALLLPHLVFFALFDYPERGAYFVVLLPVLAAALVATAAGGGAERPRPLASALAGLPFLLALAVAPARPAEAAAWGASLGALAPLWVALAAALVGLLAPGPFLTRRAAAPALLLLALLQAVGARRELAAWDREQTLADWARGACEENAGRAGVVLTGGFQERWMLDLLQRPWPEPWRGTWAFAAGLALPGPTGHSYGDPSLPEAELLRVLEEKLDAGDPVYVDAGVRRFLALQPRHAGMLERLAEGRRLEPVTNGAFRAERILRR